jgi:hypothetical protein
MLTVGTLIFLLTPDSSKKRILKPGKVIESANGTIIVQMDEAITLEDGCEVIAFFKTGNKFVQQGAVVLTAPEQNALPPGGSPIAFKLIGEAISAEKRQLYRVSVPLSNIRARIGTELACQIVDISPEGCAAITRQKYVIGSTVQIHFIHEGESVLAQARVQTCKTLSDGSYRYGFYIGDKISPARRALNAISMMVQRRQLKRLAGAA